MGKFSWMLLGLDEMSFKRMPDGWLFTAPNVGWPPRRTYRVTEKQKAGLIGLVRRVWAVQFVIGIATFIVWTNVFATHQSLTRWLAFGIGILTLMILSWVYAAFTFRPLLSGLAPTEERITFMDGFRRQATTFPMALIVGMLVGSLALVVGSIGVGLHEGWNLTDMLGVTFFGILALYWIALLIAKRRSAVQ